MPDRDTNADLNRLRRRVRAYRDEMVQTLQTLLTYPSVNIDPARLSEATVASLRFALAEAGRLGLKTRNLDDLAGYAELGPADAPETVGVLAHLDVVPAGDGWTHAPFAGVVADGAVWGRGAGDDKGPAVAALYAAVALASLDSPLSRKVRLIFGGNEEKGDWISVQHYKTLEGTPTMGFTPDGSFPVICGEKGFLHVELQVPADTALTDDRCQIVGWHAGAAPNVVPAAAWAALRIPEGKVATALHEISESITAYATAHPDSQVSALNEAEFAAQFPDDPRPVCDLALVARGREAHSAQPWEGHNAMLDLAGVLAGLDLAEEGHCRLARFIAERMGVSWDGAGLGLAVTDEKLGPTTVALTMARTTEDVKSLALNIRLTPPHTVEKATSALEKVLAPAGIELSSSELAMEPLFVDVSDPLVVALKEAYTSVTGEPAECLYMGGTTYAKAFPRTVAFGPALPGEPKMAHQVDERVEIDALVRNAEIYAVALYWLTR
jgi:succinyl-diaminopimelate desuccinylase